MQPAAPPNDVVAGPSGIDVTIDEATTTYTVTRPTRSAWTLWPSTPAPLFTALAAVTTFALLAAIAVRHMPTDVGAHVMFVVQSMQTGEWLPNFLFFRLVAILSTNSSDFVVLMLAAIVILSASVAAKYMVSVRIARTWLAADLATLSDVAAQRMTSLLMLVLFLQLYSFNLPVGGWSAYYYIGQFPSNVWHNSTTMFVMPFALALLWVGYRYIAAPSRRLLAAIVVLSILNLLAKPSFFMTFAIAFPIFVLARHRLRRPTLEAAAAFAVPVLLMLAQANTLFVAKSNAQSLGGVEWAPFVVWGLFSDDFIVSLGASLLFPMCVLAAYPRAAIRSRFYRFVALNLLAGLAVYSFLSETGPRRYDANFSWQVVVTTYMIFLASIMIVFREWARNQVLRFADWVLIGVFSLHVLSGLLYIARWFISITYL